MDSKQDMAQKLAVVILAAGKGTRMKSSLPKVMHELAGRPMISWLLETVEELAPQKIIIVAGPDMESLAQAVKPYPVVIQDTQNGTGDAVKPALPLLEGFDGKVLILMGDEPFVKTDALRAMLAEEGVSVMAVEPFVSKGLGRMVVDRDGMLESIIEDKDAGPAEKEISLCNAGNYCVPADRLAGWIDRIGNDNAQKEYYLTDLPKVAAREGVKTRVVNAGFVVGWGVNTRSELAAHEHQLQNMLREKAMEEGAALKDPHTVYFNWDTKLGKDVTIGQNVVFGAGVDVGDGAVIHPFCHLEGVKVGKNAQIGPFARLRPGTVLGEDSKIGNFVEVKNTSLGKGAKANHLSYIGDASVGAGSNIGAGTITCNYDGFDKHKTKIGEGVFVGSNATLVAPLSIEDGAYIAAGSAITEDVPANALSLARSRAIVRDGWASAYRNRKAKK